jgi:hypothetical protein
LTEVIASPRLGAAGVAAGNIEKLAERMEDVETEVLLKN